MAIKTTAKHCRDCGAAVNVKVYRLPDGGTDEQRQTAYELTQDAFWQNANAAAVAAGYSGATACGRSGGWCAPYHESANRYTFEDDLESHAFQTFADAIGRAMRGVPDDFAANLRQVIADDAEREAQREARERAEAARLAEADKLRAKVRELFALPLRVTQRATDTPDDPGGEMHAIISDGNAARLSVVLGADAMLDNARADAIAAALNAYAQGDDTAERIAPMGEAARAGKLADTLADALRACVAREGDYLALADVAIAAYDKARAPRSPNMN